MNKHESKIPTAKEENNRKKEYLNVYRKHGRRISRIDAEINEIRSMVLYPSMDNDGMPHGSNQKDLSDYVTELCEKEDALYSEGVKQWKAYNDIMYKINQLDNEDERDVLFYYYIKSKKWWEIAELMGYSERWVTELHGKALAHLKI